MRRGHSPQPEQISGVIIIRTNTFLYWTGSDWSLSQDEAKLFSDMAAAQQETQTMPRSPSGQIVHLVAVAGAN